MRSEQTHQWADGLLEGSAEHVAEDQKSQPLALLQTAQQTFTTSCIIFLITAFTTEVANFPSNSKYESALCFCIMH